MLLKLDISLEKLVLGSHEILKSSTQAGTYFAHLYNYAVSDRYEEKEKGVLMKKLSGHYQSTSLQLAEKITKEKYPFSVAFKDKYYVPLASSSYIFTMASAVSFLDFQSFFLKYGPSMFFGSVLMLSIAGNEICGYKLRRKKTSIHSKIKEQFRDMENLKIAICSLKDKLLDRLK